jgi:hypothetical protein
MTSTEIIYLTEVSIENNLPYQVVVVTNVQDWLLSAVSLSRFFIMLKNSFKAIPEVDIIIRSAIDPDAAFYRIALPLPL